MICSLWLNIDAMAAIGDAVEDSWMYVYDGVTTVSALERHDLRQPAGLTRQMLDTFVRLLVCHR